MNKYFAEGFGILRSQSILLALPAFIGAGLFLPMLEGGGLGLLPAMLVFLMYPVVCGRFVQLIKKEPFVSFGEFLRRHLLNFLAVNVLLSLPVILVVMFQTAAGMADAGVAKILMMIIDVAGIYVFPVLFLAEKKIMAISLGLRFLLGNIAYNLPVIAVALSVMLLNAFVQNVYVPEQVTLWVVLIKYLTWFFAVTADFFIFITACLIVRDVCFSANK